MSAKHFVNEMLVRSVKQHEVWYDRKNTPPLVMWWWTVFGPCRPSSLTGCWRYRLRQPFSCRDWNHRPCTTRAERSGQVALSLTFHRLVLCMKGISGSNLFHSGSAQSYVILAPNILAQWEGNRTERLVLSGIRPNKSVIGPWACGCMCLKKMVRQLEAKDECCRGCFLGTANSSQYVFQIPLQRYRSDTLKIRVILAKVHVAGYN